MSFTPAWSPPPPRRLSLGLAMAVAVLLHLFVIVLFLHAHVPLQEPLPAHLPVLQIDLTPHPDERPPERPDMVAEANQRAEETRAPETSPPPEPVPSVVKETAPVPPPAPRATPVRPKPAQGKVDGPAPAESIPGSTDPSGSREPGSGGKAETVRPPPPQPQAAPAQTLAERSLQMNRLRTDILEQSLRDDIAARSTVLTANTTYGPEAAYLRAWVEKVERVGNLNFPDEARRKKLSGRLILEVGLDDQGRVQTMRVRQSSGEPVLDQAAQDIVRLASPFAPFPSDLRMKYDQLTIIRTWVFDAGRGLDTR
ncbi:MAG: TonB family protein [Pseudomonadota bacterium]